MKLDYVGFAAGCAVRDFGYEQYQTLCQEQGITALSNDAYTLIGKAMDQDLYDKCQADQAAAGE